MLEKPPIYEKIYNIRRSILKSDSLLNLIKLSFKNLKKKSNLDLFNLKKKSNLDLFNLKKKSNLDLFNLI